MSIRFRFFGAAGEVTGSCTLIETSRARILVDFGMHQGGPNAACRNLRFPDINPQDIDAVVLTHAHIDHSGRLPMLVAHDYQGPIYATPPSLDLCEILLRDSAHLQKEDEKRVARRRARRGRSLKHSKCRVALYTFDDVEDILGQFRTVPYHQSVDIAPGITLQYFDAGHILGSAWVELVIEGEGQGVLGKNTKRILFSGDQGPRGAVLLRDSELPSACDLLVLESTYGDRDHKPLDASIKELADILDRAHTPKGKVLIPSFAVGRTQQLIYYIGEMVRDNRLPNEQVYIDSPMAIETTMLYRRYRDLFDEDTWKIISAGNSPLRFHGLHYARTPDESRAINRLGNGVAVIAASGMCTGGRILHHLKHNLWREETHVVFVGYQGQGTLGRKLVEGNTTVRVMGEPIRVNAKVHTLGGFSAHAGQSDLLRWAKPALESKPKIILNHGENRQRTILADLIEQRHGVKAFKPEYRESYVLT